MMKPNSKFDPRRYPLPRRRATGRRDAAADKGPPAAPAVAARARPPGHAAAGTPGPEAGPEAGPGPGPSAATGAADRKVEDMAIDLMNTYRQEECVHSNRRLAEKNRRDMPPWEYDLPPASAAMWRQAACRLLERGIDPGLYVRRMFAIADPLRLPRAADLGSPAKLADYERATQMALYRIGIERGIYESQFRNHTSTVMARVSRPCPSTEAAWLIVLSDGDILSPLFRYLMATVIAADPVTRNPDEFRRAAEEHRAEAALQFMRDPDAYQQVYCRLLPEGFVEYAWRVYRIVSGMRS